MRVLAKDHCRPEIVRTILARHLWQHTPSLVQLASLPNGAINYPAGGVKGRATLADLFTADKRPYQQIDEEKDQ